MNEILPFLSRNDLRRRSLWFGDEHFTNVTDSLLPVLLLLLLLPILTAVIFEVLLLFAEVCWDWQVVSLSLLVPELGAMLLFLVFQCRLRRYKSIVESCTTRRSLSLIVSLLLFWEEISSTTRLLMWHSLQLILLLHMFTERVTAIDRFKSVCTELIHALTLSIVLWTNHWLNIFFR